MSNQLKIFTDLCNNDYFILDEYDPEVYGHKIIGNDSNIVFLYDGHGTFHHDLDAVKRTIEQLRDWKMDIAKAEQERSFGLCFCLCNIISELRKKINTFHQMPIQTGYNTNLSTKIGNLNGWML